jgi:CheY-like chemotaxis protein/HPt (histidine-containing phosphotransfer) domain-containing protein
MSICKKLIELMDGHIEVSSKKNEGTAITFVLNFQTGNQSDLPAKEELVFNSSLLAGCRILLVEDNEMNRLVATTMLEHYDVEFEEAVNGEEALRLLKNAHFDLILMDVQMPVMNGIEATHAIRRDISSTIPIIALTANAIKGESDKCIAAGMNAYISKPFEEQLLVRTIISLLGKEIEITMSEKPVAQSAQALFDLEQLRQLSRGDEKFIAKMVTMFVQTAPASIAAMKSALQVNDFARVKSIAHGLKPSIDSFGIVSMKTRIRDIESYPFETNALDQLHQLIEESNSIISNVVVSFQKQFAV